MQPGSRRDPGPEPSPLVFVVDDDLSIRESLDLLIRSAGLLPETFASAQEFLARPKADGPSCLVLDMSLPGLSGLELQERLRMERSDMPIIFITGYLDVPVTVRAMKAGAMEFLTKPYGGEELIAAIRKAIEQSGAALRARARLREVRAGDVSLTPREREVMALVVTGLLNKQVGGELGISEITVKAHRGKVMHKMRAGSFAELVRMASTLGMAVGRR